MIIQDQEGNDIEVFTADDLNSKIAETKEAIQKEMSSGDEGKERNVRIMGEKIQKLEEELKKTEGLETKIRTESLMELKTELMNSISSDPDEQKKIDVYFNAFKDSMDSKETLKERLAASAKLAGVETKKEGVRFNSGFSGSDNPGAYGSQSQDTYTSSESTNQKAMRNVFGITEEQANKFGNK